MFLPPQIGDSLFYDLPRMRLDGGARAFRRRWGYELTPPPTLVEEENEDDPYDLPPAHEEDNLSYTETRSLRDDYLFSSSQGKPHGRLVSGPAGAGWHWDLCRLYFGHTFHACSSRGRQPRPAPTPPVWPRVSLSQGVAGA